jgi:hypothetical protein
VEVKGEAKCPFFWGNFCDFEVVSKECFYGFFLSPGRETAKNAISDKTI